MSTTAPSESPAFRLVPATKALANQAAELNAATKHLNEVVEKIESGLQKLNLGVSSFVTVSKYDDDTPIDALGYTKIGGRWGLVIRTYVIDGAGDCVGSEDCPFQSAPRETRIKAIGKITGLFNQMSADAAELTTLLNKNISEAEELSKLIGVAVYAQGQESRKDGKK